LAHSSSDPRDFRDAKQALELVRGLKKKRPSSAPDEPARRVGAAELEEAARLAGPLPSSPIAAPSSASSPAVVDELAAELERRRSEWKKTDDAQQVRRRVAERVGRAKRAKRAEQRKRALEEIAELNREAERRSALVDPTDEIDPSTLATLSAEERRALLLDPSVAELGETSEPPRTGPAPTPTPRPSSRRRRRQLPIASRRAQRQESRKQREKRAARNAEHVDRQRAKFLKRYGSYELPKRRDNDRPIIPRELWIRSQLIVDDKRTAEFFLSECANDLLIGAIRNAARVPLADGTTRYTFADRRARVIVALGLALWELGTETKHLEFSRLTRGVNRCALLLLVRDPHGQDPFCTHCDNTHPSVAALTGIHRADGTLETGQIGWLRALEDAGAIERYQIRNPEAIRRCCQPWELGDRGYPCAWYWSLGMLHDPDCFTDAELARFELLRELAMHLFDDETPRRVSFVRSKDRDASQPELDPPP
jgi:hypothetical protein